jgi:ABC-2 type transport system ATP-binding protein
VSTAAVGGAIPAAVCSEHLKRTFFVKEAKQHVVALDDISLSIAPGALTALVGPDGAGKTTFLRLAAGLLKPDAGTLTVLGIDVVSNPQEVQNRISYMPQRFGLYEDLSVQENLDLYADLHGVPAEERGPRYARLMEMTDLARFTDRLAGKLSGGMKQKLGLACALVRSPELLLLDEPTVGVDPLSRRELWAIVEQLVDVEKLTVLVSTGYLDEAERCVEVFLLRAGRVLACGTPQVLRAHAEGRCFIATPPAGQPARLLQSALLDDTAHVVDAVPQGGEVRFIAMPPISEVPQLASLQGMATRPVDARLEDGYMVLVRENEATPAAAPAVSAAPPLPQGTAGEVVIEVKDLVRKFGDFVAVADTTFSVRRGEVFGLLGPNGAGKTTTFRMLCGLLPATSGSLKVAGVDLRHARAPARRHVGYVSQKFALYGTLSPTENLEFFAGAYGLRGPSAKARIQAVIDQFELAAVKATPSNQLPGGFRQRLAMAAALLHEPEILFLDEPTSGADPRARREFWRRITSLAAAGTTIVVTTHFMEEAEYCDRIVIQDAGKVLAIGTPKAVREQAAGDDSKQASMTMDEAFIEIVKHARALAPAGATRSAA